MRHRWLCRLARQFSMELQLLLRRETLSLLKLLLMLLVLMLLGTLQDLRSVLARETGRHTWWHSLHSLYARHTGERRLPLEELLRVLRVLLGVAHAGRRLHRGRPTSLVAN